MELIISISVICTILLLFIQATQKPLVTQNRISGSRYQYSLLLVFVFCFILTFAAAFREGFQDTGVYKVLYKNIGTDFENALDEDFDIQDYGFNLFMILLNRINSDPQFLIIITSVITFSAYFYVVTRYAEDLPFSLLLLLCVDYIGAINGIRQILAGAILILALPWLRDKKVIPYVLLVLLLSTIHGSIIVMLPLCLIIVGKRLNPGIWIFFGLVVMCFAFPSVADQVMGSILEDSVYEAYLDNEAQMGIMRLLVALVPTIISLLYCWIQQDNHAGENINNKDYPHQRMIDVLINMQLISFGFTALGLRMVYFARISMYFSCVLPILLPVLIKGCFTDKSAQTVKRIAIAMYLFYFAYQIYTYDSIGGWAGFELVF